MTKNSPWGQGPNNDNNDQNAYNNQNGYRGNSQHNNNEQPPKKPKSSLFIWIAVALIGYFLINWLFEQNPNALSNQSGQIDFTHNILLLAILIGSFFMFRKRADSSTTGKMALIWLIIFAGGFFIVSVYEDFKTNTQFADEVSIENATIIRQNRDGHYYLRLNLDGTNVMFMIDTGATGVVLRREDADRMGLNLNASDFTSNASTANGTVPIAPIIINEVSADKIYMTNLRAFVNGGELSTSLLGMTFLNRLSSYEFKNQTLILRP